ncbi:CBS domain-containing protein, partial [Phyllobacterium sp. P5_D12]
IAIMEGGRIIQCGTAQDILLNPADEYVADFVANMNPLGVLTAADIMVPLDRTRPASRPFAATARPETPVREIMQAIAKNSGDVGVVENGAFLGMISADDIVRGLLKHQKH